MYFSQLLDILLLILSNLEKTAMVLININFLKPGMKLVSDLKTPKGHLLLPQGNLLDERIIARCKKWGVTQADVEAPDNSEEEESLQELDPEALSRAKEHVRDIFSRQKKGSRFIKVLAAEALEQKARALNSQDPAPETSSREEAEESSNFTEEDLPKLEMDAIVQKTEELATLPEVFAKIIKTLNDPETTADSLAEIISYDVNLSTKIIKLVNSPLYGLIQKVDSISRAISLLGMQTVKNLAVNASVMEMFSDLSPEFLDMRSFWKHSIACGVVAQLLWGSTGRKGEEIFFLSGTLHDLGRLIILKQQPEYMKKVLIHPQRGQKPLFELEKKIWGFTHQELGAYLIASWNFPATFQDLLRYHHFPKNARYPTEATNIHFADIIVHALEIGDSGEKNVPLINPQLEKDLAINSEQLREILPQINYVVSEMQEIFFQQEE